MAILTHGMYILGEHPHDVTINSYKQASLLDRAETLGLKTEIEWEDWSIYVFVYGNVEELRKLETWATKSEIYVDVEEG